MRKYIAAFVAIVTLVIAGWCGLRAFSGNETVDGASAFVEAAVNNLPDSPEEWQGKIDYRALEHQLAELSLRPEMAGLAVAVVEDGKLTFVRTYGVTDRSTRAPVTPRTMFRWASVSKTTAGVLAAEMADDGKVNLKRPVASWPTSLRLPGGAEAQVTFEQLLAQQTGLTKNAYDERLEEGQRPGFIRASLVAAPLQCDPGTCHTYQNIAFDAASEILGLASRKPYADVVRERLFRPLGMASASFGMAGLTRSNDWAKPHNGASVRELREAYWRVPAAAGVDSNIVDFARWMQAMMGQRPDVLPAKVLRLAHAPRVRTAPLYGGDLRQAISDAHYGLGWRSFNYAGHRLEGHSGAVDGYRATMIFEPATRTGVVVLWNSNWGRPFRIPFAVIDSYHNRTDTDWLDLGDLPSGRG